MIFRRGNKFLGKIENGYLVKSVKEDSHLLKLRGGVPAIDAGMWDENKDKVSGIIVNTDKGRVFSISKDEFDYYKEGVDYGWGKQYTVQKDFWQVEVSEPAQKGTRQGVLNLHSQAG